MHLMKEGPEVYPLSFAYANRPIDGVVAGIDYLQTRRPTYSTYGAPNLSRTKPNQTKLNTRKRKQSGTLAVIRTAVS